MFSNKAMDQDNPRIFYLYPEIHDSLQYSDDFYRAIFYLSPLLRRGDTILVPSSRDDTPYGHAPATFLDGCVAELAAKVRDHVEIRPLKEANARFESFAGQHVICLWDETLRGKDPFLKRNGARLIRADHRRVQHASSIYLKASSLNGQGTPQQRRASKRRLGQLLDELRSERVLIFGTGPSLDQVDFETLPDGLHIATNSMITNRPLLAKMRPRLIVASDPIFHAGASKYAEEFRSLLVEAMRLYEASFIFPMRDIGIYENLLPEDVRSRLVGVPTKDDGKINLNLAGSFKVSSTRNVMTLFLLPLAANLAREVILVGFDGRPVEENSYFWSHSNAFQLVDHMSSIREAHPAFFNIDYDEYYRDHCTTVEAYLREMEAQGRVVASLTDSYIPPIKGRYLAPSAAAALSHRFERPQVSIVMPLGGSLAQLKEAVRSVQDQSVKDWELLCVDWNGEKGSRGWLGREAKRDGRIVCLKARGQSLAEALNLGLAAARGHYICFLDGRDRLTASSLRRRLQFLRTDPILELCGGKVEVVDGAGRRLGIRQGRPVTARLRHARGAIFHLNSLFGVGHVMKRFSFNPHRPYCEAWYYMMQQLQFGWLIGACGEKPVAEVRWEDPEETLGDPLGRFASARLILDELLHPPKTPFVPNGIPVTLSQTQASRSKVRRLQSLFVGQVLLGDRLGQDTVIDMMREQPAVPFLQPVSADFFETLAAQSFLEPKGSEALRRKIKDRYEEVFAACERLQGLSAQWDFAVAFCGYAMQTARSLAAVDKVKPPFGEAERRVKRQLALLWIKEHLRHLRYEAGTGVRMLRVESAALSRYAMEKQRNVRRRWRRSRRDRKRRKKQKS